MLQKWFARGCAACPVIAHRPVKVQQPSPVATTSHVLLPAARHGSWGFTVGLLSVTIDPGIVLGLPRVPGTYAVLCRLLCH
jgi:hypothetical protein